MRPRFQADVDFNHKIILGIRRRETAIDFQDARAARVIGLPDIEVLAIAAESGRILVSHDRSTMTAHFVRFTATRSSPGLIIVSQDLDIRQSIEDLLLVRAASAIEEWQNKIGYVPI